MELLDALLDPWRSGIDRRALLEVAAARRPLRRAVVLGHELPPELPGGVAGPRAAARPRAGGAGRRAAAAGRRRGRGGGRGAGGAGRARRAHRRRHGHRRGGHRHVRPRRAAGAVARRPGAPGGAAVRRPARREPTPTWRRRPALALVGGAALVALHRPLAAVAFDPGAARRARRGARRACGWRCWSCWPRRSRWRCRGLGSLLVLAVLVAPAVAVRRHARQPRAGRCSRAPRWRVGRRRRRPLRLAPPGHRRRRLGGAGAVRGRGAGSALPALRRPAAPARAAQPDDQRGARARSSPC